MVMFYDVQSQYVLNLKQRNLCVSAVEWRFVERYQHCNIDAGIFLRGKLYSQFFKTYHSWI